MTNCQWPNAKITFIELGIYVIAADISLNSYGDQRYAQKEILELSCQLAELSKLVIISSKLL